MKKQIVLTVMLVGIVSFGTETSKNLLENGGFENTQIRKSQISGWKHADWGGRKNRGRTSVIINDDVKEGKSAVQLTTTGKKRNNLLLYQDISKKLQPGKTYLLTFSFKAADEDAIGARVYSSIMINNKKLLYEHSKPMKATKDWQEIEFSFTMPEKKFTNALIMLRSNKKDVIFDNAVLELDDF